LLEGARGTYIATLVERQSRYVMLVRLPNRETQTVIRALARRIRRLPQGPTRSTCPATAKRDSIPSLCA
jgi:IS30 family transposase